MRKTHTTDQQIKNAEGYTSKKQEPQAKKAQNRSELVLNGEDEDTRESV
jgi:hypothetical protein